MDWVNVLENSWTRFFIYDLFEQNWIANFIRGSSCFIVLSSKGLLCPKNWEMFLFYFLDEFYWQSILTENFQIKSQPVL